MLLGLDQKCVTNLLQTSNMDGAAILFPGFMSKYHNQATRFKFAFSPRRLFQKKNMKTRCAFKNEQTNLKIKNLEKRKKSRTKQLRSTLRRQNKFTCKRKKNISVEVRVFSSSFLIAFLFILCHFSG